MKSILIFVSILYCCQSAIVPNGDKADVVINSKEEKLPEVTEFTTEIIKPGSTSGNYSIIPIGPDVTNTTTSTTSIPPTTTNGTTTTSKPTDPTTSKPPPTSPTPSTTTTKPTSTTPKPSPTKPTSTTPKPSPTTPKPTTEKPIPSSTEAPVTSTTAIPPSNRGFDGPSFIGGIVLASGLMAIGFVALKFYRARTELNYHTL